MPIPVPGRPDPHRPGAGLAWWPQALLALLARLVRAALLALPLLAGAWLPALADELPSARDGLRHSAVFNGKQNMPVKLVGVAAEWELACLRGDAEQCLRLARAFETGLGDLRADPRVALGYHLKACDKGSGEACALAAKALRDGSAGFTDPALALARATRGCESLGNADACAAMAAGQAAQGGPGSAEQAAKAMADACAAGSDDGCRLQAAALYYGDRDGAKLRAAVERFDEACRGNRAWGCTGLAEAHLGGRGAERDEARAQEAARRGCLEAEGGRIAACAIYGRLLSRSGSTAERKLATRLLAKACLGRDPFACNDAGEIGLQRRDGSGIAAWEVALYFRDGCDLDLALACRNLADVYGHGFDAVEPHPAVRHALLTKACRLGDAPACSQAEQAGAPVGRLPIDPSLPALQQLALAGAAAERGERRGVLSTVVRLMHEGVAQAQWMLAGWLYYGKPGLVRAPRQDDGVILFENAARQGHVEAAKWIGMAYWYGNGVAQNQDKGHGYMAIAAERGDEAAAAILRSMQAEPIRQAHARREREMAEEAERRKNDWGYQLGLAMAAWRGANPGRAAPSPASRLDNASWQRSQQALDRQLWNNAINHATGRTSACPMSNPYCR